MSPRGGAGRGRGGPGCAAGRGGGGGPGNTRGPRRRDGTLSPSGHRSPELPGRRCAVPPATGGDRRGQGRERRTPRSALLCGESGGLSCT
ncbi:MAG TPA: hypothetical protein DD420_28580 [Streptomyces sp.]|nr:hypothetical protein [Streptomyces sp.]